MTKAELQEYLRLSKISVQKLMKEGLPYIRLARKLLFRKVDVDKWLEKKVQSYK